MAKRTKKQHVTPLPEVIWAMPVEQVEARLATVNELAAHMNVLNDLEADIAKLVKQLRS